MHKFKPVKCRITCETYFKYHHFTRTINKSLHNKEHICGEKYCNTSNDYVDENHQCFMKPDVTEFPSEEQDQFTIKLISTKKHNQSDSDEDVSSVYIFFLL